MYVAPNGYLAGIAIYITNLLYETESTQIRFPRSKRRRTRRKWAKRSENYRTKRISKPAIQIGNSLYMTPEMWMDLKRQFPEADQRGIRMPIDLGAMCRPTSIVRCAF